MKEKRGITLIALVITIIVLLILAGVSLALLVGENGILKRATTTVEKNEKATVEEELKLAINEYWMEKVEILDRKMEDFLTENLKGLTISEVRENSLIVEYKGYEFEIDEQSHVTNLGKANISVLSTLTPDTYTKENVAITLNVTLENGLVLENITPISEGIEVVEQNKAFRVTENGMYEFEIVASGGNQKTVKVKVDKIDQADPEVIITNMPEEVMLNELFTIGCKITDDTEIDWENCKFIFSYQNVIWTEDNVIWNYADTMSPTSETLTIKLGAGKSGDKLYFHMLIKDKVGNCVSYTHPDAITVK